MLMFLEKPGTDKSEALGTFTPQESCSDEILLAQPVTFSHCQMPSQGLRGCNLVPKPCWVG